LEINQAIVGPRDVEIIQSIAVQAGAKPLARWICLFSPFWVRGPQTNSANDVVGLLNHLFILHEVPKFLYSEWTRKPEFPALKWLCWFIVLGQGSSLHRAARHLNWKIPGQFSRYLSEAPADLSAREVCLYAEVRRLGGAERDFRRIHQNDALRIDPTDVDTNESEAKFWYDAARWLIAHGDDFSDEESERILAWAVHEQTEAERDQRPPFLWKGRSARATLDRAEHYFRRLSRPWSAIRWRGHGWNWFLDQGPLDEWSFIELTNGQDLFLEGQRMHHCVAGYAQRCAAGTSAIVSVSHNKIGRVTVEIDPRNGQVVQARGECNRPAGPEEQAVISLWMNQVVRPTPPA
jgi:hypothetical protein